jgi:hypothetical protein
MIAGSAAPERLLARFAGGKRTSTLQGRVSAYKTLKGWLQINHSKSFPTREIEVIDYILDRAAEPCGPSIPGTVLGMLTFLETAGGKPAGSRISDSSVLKGIVSEVQLELRSANPISKRKARQIPSIFVASWEILVCDTSVFEAFRLQAWKVLVMLWASLRTGDTAGIPQDELQYRMGSLYGQILCSKTTGSGKSVGAVPFHVDGRAWLVMEDWLKVGWNLFVQHKTGLDYLLPLPAPGMEEFSDQEPSYSQQTAILRKLLMDATVPIYSEVSDSEGFGEVSGWKASQKQILLEGMQTFWTGHSLRCTLPTWAAALSFPKQDRDYLGRWKPMESDEYLRNVSEVVGRIQAAVATKLRTRWSGNELHEDPLRRELKIYSLVRGYEETEVELMLEKITHKGFCSGEVVELSEDEEAEVFSGSLPFPADFDPAAPVDLGDSKAQLPEGQLVLSLDGGGKSRTLHKVGACWRIPGIHFRRFREVQSVEDVEAGCGSLCKDCWPAEDIEAMNSEASDSASSVDSSDSN